MKAAERLAERGEPDPPRRSRRGAEARVSAVPAGARTARAANEVRRPRTDPEAVARWAQEHQLPYDDGHVQFPDARLEYEDRDGRRAVEDIEVVTPHYRGAHAAAKVSAGFTRYRAAGARLGGLRTTGRSGRGVDPRLAEELLSVTSAERIRAVAEKGFTERQAGFLVTVMLHSGVCVGRQVLRLRSHRPRAEGARLLRLPGGKEVGHGVRRGASTSPHLPRSQQAPLCRHRRAEQPQPQARYARPAPSSG